MRSLILLFLLSFVAEVSAKAVFAGIAFKPNDSILVSDDFGAVLYEWQADKMLIPASLTKLATANLAINKWGLSHQFVTDFYRTQDTLWVKGYGDPFLVSEELDSVAAKLMAFGFDGLTQIHIDNSHFDVLKVPGRSKVADPYNAPLSAVSANFNTAKLSKLNGVIKSAEAQTPLTPTAKKMAHSLAKKTDRVNLVNSDNAQRNFAELLILKLGLKHLKIKINQRVPANLLPFYQHKNSRSLADVVRGTLEFSNNFMANQVFLKLAEDGQAGRVSFSKASVVANAELSRQFNWRGANIVEGAGLSRANRLSAKQVDDLLIKLKPSKTLFKKINTKTAAQVYAKTGTLDGVRSYAGYIQIDQKNYRFVFNFNRKVAYLYREQMLERLLNDLIP